MTSERIAYIVPTKDRPEDLAKLLQSLMQQTVMPHQIVIVDGSAPPIEHVLGSFSDLPLTYVRVFPPSLARQRNAGVAALASDISIAGYLDDDLVLEPKATEEMLAFWSAATPNTGGAAFSIVNQPCAFSNRLARLFYLDDPRPGRVLRSGFQSQIPPIERLTETDWLYGGATTWRRRVLDTIRYDEWYLGHGYLEDVDYSYRVGQQYQLFVVGDARCWHFSRPIARNREFAVGRQQVVNRLYFFRKMGTFSPGALAWAFLGQSLLNVASCFRRREVGGLLRFAGNIAGLMSLLGGRLTQIGGYYK